MNYKMLKTRKTKESGLDKIDYEYELEFNGKYMTLRTRWKKNGLQGGVSFSAIEAEDIPTIEKVFPDIKFECLQYDGTPTFNRKGDRLHLVHAEQVTPGPGLLEV